MNKLTAAGVLAALVLVAAAPALAQPAGALAAAGGGGAAAAAGPLPAATLAGQCKPSAGVSPWDVGNHFPNLSICCGGSIDFQWSGTSGVWQISSTSCPSTFANSSTARQLIATTAGSGGVQSLYLATPGTYYLTSPTPGACSGGLQFTVQVPPGSGTVCPIGAPAPPGTQQISTGPGSMAAAQGTPGGTSTSTGQGSAAAASGPPGTSQTATGPGMAFSRSGGRRLRWDEAW